MSMLSSYLKIGLLGILLGVGGGSLSVLAQAQQTAQIIFYQKGGFQSNLFELHINKQPIATPFKLRRKFEVKVPADTLMLETRNRRPGDRGQRFQFVAQAGQTYFIEGVLDYDFMVNRMYLFVREPERAQADLIRLKKDPNARTEAFSQPK